MLRGLRIDLLIIDRIATQTNKPPPTHFSPPDPKQNPFVPPNPNPPPPSPPHATEHKCQGCFLPRVATATLHFRTPARSTTVTYRVVDEDTMAVSVVEVESQRAVVQYGHMLRLPLQPGEAPSSSSARPSTVPGGGGVRGRAAGGGGGGGRGGVRGL